MKYSTIKDKKEAYLENENRIDELNNTIPFSLTEMLATNQQLQTIINNLLEDIC